MSCNDGIDELESRDYHPRDARLRRRRTDLDSDSQVGIGNCDSEGGSNSQGRKVHGEKFDEMHCGIV